MQILRHVHLSIQCIRWKMIPNNKQKQNFRGDLNHHRCPKMNWIGIHSTFIFRDLLVFLCVNFCLPFFELEQTAFAAQSRAKCRANDGKWAKTTTTKTKDSTINQTVAFIPSKYYLRYTQHPTPLTFLVFLFPHSIVTYALTQCAPDSVAFLHRTLISFHWQMNKWQSKLREISVFGGIHIFNENKI